MITQSKLKELVVYEPDTGDFLWRKDHSRAGGITADGYYRCQVLGTKYLVHRLIWLYMTGEWPPEDIDHKNNDRADNRWDNIRQASRAQNQHNRVTGSSNTSGVKGVHRNKSGWQGRVIFQGVRHNRTFPTLEEASHWVQAQRTLLHQEFARHE